MTFVGHVPNALHAREVSEAGQKSIEHIFLQQPDLRLFRARKTNSAKNRPKRAPSATAPVRRRRGTKPMPVSVRKRPRLSGKTMVRNKTWLVPTLVAIRAIAQQRETGAKRSARARLSPAGAAAKWSPNEIEKEVSPQVAQWYLAQFQNDLKIARAPARGRGANDGRLRFARSAQLSRARVCTRS